jgi:glycosyltransferase involved in cell wall biosynthesis
VPTTPGGLRNGVVLCTYGLNPGGAERQWVYLARALTRIGVRVTFVTYEPLVGACAHYLPLLKDSGVPTFDASGIVAHTDSELTTKVSLLSRELGFGEWGDTCVSRLAAALRTLTPAVVYAQLDEPNLFAGIASRLCGVERFVMSFRSQNPTHFGWFQRWMLPSYRWLGEWSEVRYTANGAAAAASYAEWLEIPVTAVEVIPNMLDPTDRAMRPPDEVRAVRAELKLALDDKIILGVFRLHPEKDPFTFLNTAEIVLRSFPTARFLLVGDGPLRAEVSSRVRALGIQESVLLLGNRQDVPALMSAATLLLHPSRMEGMSNTVMEAQSSGLPVVAFDIPGVRETVDVDRSARLCAPGDAGALVQACLELLAEPSRVQEMAAAGRRFAASRFDADVVCAGYLRVGLRDHPHPWPASQESGG